MTADSGRGTARQTVRIPSDEWDEFGVACEAAGLDRSQWLLDAMRWALGRSDAIAPEPLPPGRPAGIDTRIDGRTLKNPKGHTVYAVTADARDEDVTAALTAADVGLDGVRMSGAGGGRTLVEVTGRLDRIVQIRETLLAADIDVEGARA